MWGRNGTNGAPNAEMSLYHNLSPLAQWRSLFFCLECFKYLLQPNQTEFAYEVLFLAHSYSRSLEQAIGSGARAHAPTVFSRLKVSPP